MLRSRQGDVIPLPSVTGSSAGAWFTDGVGFRIFGKFETDLAVDFSVPNRAALATRLLELCVVDPEGLLPPRHFIELSIGQRIACLLLLAAGGWERALSLVFTCQGCGEDLELDLTFKELSDLQREADQIETVGIDLEEAHRISKAQGPRPRSLGRDRIPRRTGCGNKNDQYSGCHARFLGHSRKSFGS